MAVYLPGLWSIPPVDRDECRFAQASRQMFEAAVYARAPESGAVGPGGLGRFEPARHDGGWAIPKVQERERLNKPPLIYWLQVASAWVCTGGDPLRDAIWMYRLPSVLGAAGTVLITWRMGLWMMDARAAWLGAGLLGVAPMVVWDAHQARADSVMMCCTTAAMACLWRVWGMSGGMAAERLSSPRGGLAWPAAFWCAMAAGVMTKGFVTPMVAGLAMVFLAVTTRRWSWLGSVRPVLGGAILFASIGPWVYAVALHLGGVGAYGQLVWGEFFVRGVAGSKEGHFAPPGTHTVLLAALFWPGSLLTLAAFGRGWRLGLGRGRPAERFLIAWIVPAWVLFELSPAKLPHYTMPMLPAVALLSGRMVLAMQARWRPAGARAGAPGGMIGGAQIGPWALIGAIAPAVVLGEALAGWRGAAIAGGIGAVIGLGVAYGLRTGRPLGVQVGGLAYSVVVLGLVLSTVATLAPGATSARLVKRLERIDPEGRRPLASVYGEDSMVFGTRGRVERMGIDSIPGWLAGRPAGLAIIPMTAGAEAGPWRVVASERGGELGRAESAWLIVEKTP